MTSQPRGAIRTCSACLSGMKEHPGKTPEGVPYKYYRCENCGEEIMDATQLRMVAERYRSDVHHL